MSYQEKHVQTKRNGDRIKLKFSAKRVANKEYLEKALTWEVD